MRKLANVLYVTTPTAYLSLDGENAVVTDGDTPLGRVPLHNIEGIVYFGYKGASPALMGKCAQEGISLCFLSPTGKFLARVAGPIKGNVVLRQTQVLLSSGDEAVPIARNFLIGKLCNSKNVLRRALRDHALRIDGQKVTERIAIIDDSLSCLSQAQTIQELMGFEGSAAKAYFDVFDDMILRNKEKFVFAGRVKHPALDPVNAMLSLAYTVLGNEIAAALECVGLDPYIGFLHQMRPGRKSLALDMLEELRAPFADRFVLTMINLGIITSDDFIVKENGTVLLKDEARKTFLSEWQKRKQEIITHPFLKEKIKWGLVPYAQAVLMSRYMRADIDAYPPFFWK